MDMHAAATCIQSKWQRRKRPVLSEAAATLDEPSSRVSMGKLLAELAKEVSLLRRQNMDLEARNRQLCQEMEALRREELALRTRAASEEKRLQDEIAHLQRKIVEGGHKKNTAVTIIANTNDMSSVSPSMPHIARNDHGHTRIPTCADTTFSREMLRQGVKLETASETTRKNPQLEMTCLESRVEQTMMRQQERPCIMALKNEENNARFER
jgi:hypothetical protein